MGRANSEVHRMMTRERKNDMIISIGLLGIAFVLTFNGSVSLSGRYGVACRMER
jgi:hypothetical protein